MKLFCHVPGGSGGTRRPCFKASQILFLIAIVFAVLAFGGTEPASFSVAEILLFLAAIVMLITVSTEDIPFRVPKAAIGVPLLVTGVAIIGLCPMPGRLLETLGRTPLPYGIHWNQLTISPYATRTQLLTLVSCSIAFYFGMLTGTERKGKRLLIYSLAGLGAAEAFYGFVQYLGGWQKIFFYTKKYDLFEATGTYINRNHYAGFLEMVIPFCLALASYEFARLSKSKPRNGWNLKRLSIQERFPQAVFWLAVTILLFAALAFSKSRMGIIASSASILGMIIAGKFKPGNLIVAGVFVALVAAMVLWIGAGPITERFASTSQEYKLSEGSRLAIWRDTIHLIKKHPLAGDGLGTFPVAYTAVQTTFLGNFVNHAHNDYLEVASDLGIPVSLILFGSFGAILASSVRSALSKAMNFDRAVALGCAGSIFALLLHSLTDFNLYIPANALVFSAILGLAVSATAPQKQISEVASSTSQLVCKRTLDAVFAFAGLVLLMPLFLIIAVAIKLDSTGPVLFRLRAAGQFGHPFDQLKFRTMVENARQKMHPFETSRSDPRITRVGRVLRRWSLDELPQLVNIMRGEMSLVGPRPTFIEIAPRLSAQEAQRFLARPGLTGLAQIHGRNMVPWPQRINLDIEYIDHFSLWTDLKILVRTIPLWLRGEGIYGVDGHVRMPDLQEYSKQ